jgi:hypothetical protein
MNWDRIEPSTPIVDTEFSFVNYHEAERRLDASKRNWERAAAILKGLDAAKRPAFFELVYYPVAGAYFTDARTLLAQKNRLYARQGRASANQYADQAEAFLKNAEEATQDYYDLLNGKWTKAIVTNGRSDKNFMPPLTRIENAAEPAMGLAIEGDEEKLMVGGHDALPWFDSIYKKKHHFEVFNRGLRPFGYRISASDDWIKTSRTEGSCGSDARIEVEIDYDRLAKADGRKEKHEGSITISGAGATRTIDVIAFTPASVQPKDVAGRFVEEGGCISINAENFQRTHDGNGFGWKVTPHLGVTGASIGAYPFSATPVDFEWKLEKEGACAEYDFYSFNRGWVDVYTYALPTAPINSQRHSLYAVSIDKGAPLIVDFETQLRSEAWKQNVQRNQSVDKTRHFIKNAGQHTLKLWMIDTGVFIDKIVMDFGGLKQSYMGPEQTRVE